MLSVISAHSEIARRQSPRSPRTFGMPELYLDHPPEVFQSSGKVTSIVLCRFGLHFHLMLHSSAMGPGTNVTCLRRKEAFGVKVDGYYSDDMTPDELSAVYQVLETELAGVDDVALNQFREQFPVLLLSTKSNFSKFNLSMS